MCYHMRMTADYLCPFVLEANVHLSNNDSISDLLRFKAGDCLLKKFMF